MSEFKYVKANALSIAKRGLILGVGVNDADYMAEVRVNGKRIVCPAYRAWKHILRRCYCEKFLSKNETYREVKVCDEWHIFTNFKQWWDVHHIDGWQIDKDLLTDSKEYSPESCLYVPRWLNNFTEDHRNARGKYKIGAVWSESRGCFYSQCSNPFGSSNYVGLFSTEDEAHNAWMVKKKEYALIFKPKMDEIDLRIYPRVIQIIERSK